MTTYFDTLRTPYQKVSISDEGVSTSDFIDATEGVVKLFDLLGSSAFAVVQNDMNGNIKKIRDRLLATGPDLSGTLELLVKNEGQPGDKKRTATEGLMWLLRGLDFTAKALHRSLDNPTEELSASFTAAYENSLRKYHSIVVRPLFSLAMKACPYRKDFYAKLGPSEEKVRPQLSEWLEALEKIVARMHQFYEYSRQLL
ncbi:het-c2 protein [Malassezia pachydermatis]|uniref:Het-c2 protein n=1 Tax=Malassezia pachydermatis TaxID=77020 RepID=A0A0M8MYG4_9BASI|nr:het-c2 protein [Malassezia pachydermatis]KOS16091.1 het-c2 protein [Malassezia pachydermatis]